MITGKVTLRRYGWRVVYFMAADRDDADEILDALKRVGCPLKRLKKAEMMLRGRSCDTGFTYSDKKRRFSCITISQTKDFSELINTFVHELDHVAKHVTLAMEIDPFSERASYLIGELARDVFVDLTSNLFCK